VWHHLTLCFRVLGAARAGRSASIFRVTATLPWSSFYLVAATFVFFLAVKTNCSFLALLACCT